MLANSGKASSISAPVLPDSSSTLMDKPSTWPDSVLTWAHKPTTWADSPSTSPDNASPLPQRPATGPLRVSPWGVPTASLTRSARLDPFLPGSYRSAASREHSCPRGRSGRSCTPLGIIEDPFEPERRGALSRVKTCPFGSLRPPVTLGRARLGGRERSGRPPWT